MKKMRLLFIAAALMCGAMMMTACGSGEKDYKVTVKDAFGNVYPGVIVQFMQDGEKAGMQACNEEGIATKTLAAGDYTVELQFTDKDASYYYEEEGLTLSKSETELEVILSRGISDDTEPTMVYASVTDADGNENGGEYEAYPVLLGSTYVELNEGERNFFMFTPSEAGTYEFSVVEGDGTAIGYYGTPFYIHTNSIEEVTDNKCSVSITKSMVGEGETGTSVLMIGIDAAAGTTECILGVERIGDAEYSIEEDEPWTVYKTTADLAPYTVPEGTELVDFDIEATTDTYKLVYNEEDGFYHLDSANGPLVYVWLTENPQYIDCFETMVASVAMTRYFFDENGDFVKKEIYDQCLREYFACADEDYGVYPLTEDLKYIIQQKGEGSGWFDVTGHGYIFVDRNGDPLPGINSEISWLFMCCYAK